MPIQVPELISPFFVGRRAELAEAERRLRTACAGAGSTLLVSAEAGVGKSRLLAEVKQIAAALEAGPPRIIEGHCFEEDRAVPYAALIDALRGMVAAHDPTSADGVALMARLQQLNRGGDASEQLPPEQQRRELNEAVIAFIEALAQERPLLVAIEDVHWSDEATSELLLPLARRVRTLPVLLVVTYRSDEVDARLRRLLSAFDHERLAGELRLQRLDVAEVAELLRSALRLDRPVRAGFLQEIFALTDGNTYFIEETLKALAASPSLAQRSGEWDRALPADVEVPRSVEDAVLRRVEGLSVEARTVLQTAAVTGRRFDFDLLARVTGLNEGHLLPLVRELVEAQLVVEQSADRFAFRHALTREAVYRGLLARERRALHRAVAEAMEHDGAADAGELADLSYHCYEGALWDRVLIYARAAGEQAAALFAPAATIEHLTRVIDACRQLGATAPAAVLRLRGQAYELTGEFELARADHEAALALARAANDRQAEWRALLDLGMLWSGQDYAEAGRAYRGALRVSRELHDERAYADTLNQLGNWSSNTGSPLLGLPRHERALAIFRSLGDAAGVARTLDLAAMACLLGCDHVRAAEYYEQAVAAFAALDDRRGLASSLACLAPLCGAYHTDTAVAAVDYERALTAGERALRLSHETGWRAGESFALWNMANAIGPRGEYNRALELAHQSLAIAEEIEHRQWIVAALCAITAIYEDLLAPETARPYAERALPLARETKSWLWIGQATARQALLLATRGDANAAYELLAPLLIARTRGEVSGLRLVRCEAAELALRASEPERALSLVDALIDSLPGAARPVPRLLWLRGRALTVLGRRNEAAEALRLARTQAEADRLPALQWRIDVSLGELARADGRPGDAAAAFTRVRTLMSELAPRIPEGTLRDGFRDNVGRLLPGGDSEGGSVTVRAAAPGGLTPREREVASLLASGLSNREVAEQLVLSERTVESHVSSALAKLQLRSRTQLATWAIQAGLAQP